MSHAIRAVELTKSYEMYARPVDRLLEAFSRVPRHTVFPALQSVSLEVAKGETLGVIGTNGAGKSTLLKLIAGVVRPTSGELEVDGTIASIIELGTGFHPEFSGRDNAVFNATVLGLPAAEIDRRLPAIIAFSELDGFIDRPVRTWSSGMQMRLAFSIAINTDPDVLIIDEALAVGDGRFQKKCVDAIRAFQARGKTILFCSHALYFVTTLCERALWLDRGSVRRMGQALDVVHAYEAFLLERDRQLPASAVPEELPPSPFELEVELRPPGDLRLHDPLEIRARVAGPGSEQARLSIAILRAADATVCHQFEVDLDGSKETVLRLERLRLTRGEYGVLAELRNRAGEELASKELRPAFTVLADRYQVGILDIGHSWEEKMPLEDVR